MGSLVYGPLLAPHCVALDALVGARPVEISADGAGPFYTITVGGTRGDELGLGRGGGRRRG